MSLTSRPATGAIFWVTGLSGAGKSENAGRIARYLRSNSRPCVLLDGDEIREVIRADKKCFTRAERITLGLQYGRLCKLLSSQGIDVVIATIALYSEIHEWKSRNLPQCCTIYLDVPIEELRRRDPKQIYARYFANELSNVAGLDLAVDIPPRPEIHISWAQGMDQDKIWAILRERLDLYLQSGASPL